MTTLSSSATAETAMTTSRLAPILPHALALRSAALRVDACAGLARVVLEQIFANDHDEPLSVSYRLPLPADAAVSGFRFRIGERVIEGEIDVRRRARERFERAVAAGKSAALLEQERTSLFSQEIGNVPPHTELCCEIVIDQRLRWLDEDDLAGSWEWRFPLAAAPRYLAEPGRVTDASAVSLEVGQGLGVRASLHMKLRDALGAGSSPESPSHPLVVVPEGDGFQIALGSGNRVPLDRDVVVRWAVAAEVVRARADVAGPRGGLEDAHALVCLVPPVPEAIGATVARDLTLLVDTSGSMDGEPLAQAKEVVVALLETLTDRDRFELIEFSWRPRRFRRGRSRATAAHKHAATQWVRSLRASGGTEMHEAIVAALEPLDGDRQHQVVLVSDGLIGFEQQIVARVLDLLPNGARLHTVGVGSAVNRSLTSAAARAGRGVEVLIGLGEDPRPAARRLCARTTDPVCVELEVDGSAVLETVPARLPDLFAGAPVLIGLRVRAEGGEIVVRGKTASGTWQERLPVARQQQGSGSDAIVALFGREAVEDAETRLAAGADRERIDAEVERLGLGYRVATRMTSWVAVDREPSVDPRAPARRETVPQALPYGMSVEGLGLRPAAPGPLGMALGATVACAGVPKALAGPLARAGRRLAMTFASYEQPLGPDDDEPERAAPAPARQAPRSDREVAPGEMDEAPSFEMADAFAEDEHVLEPAPEPRAPAAPPPVADGRRGRAAAKGKGVLQRVADRITRYAGLGTLGGPASPRREERDAGAEQTGAPKPKKAARPRPAATGERARLLLTARIVVQEDGRLVVEMRLPEAVDWQPDRVRVWLAGRSDPLAVRIDWSHTTRPGPVGAQLVVRLALELDEGALLEEGPPSAIPERLELDSGMLTLEVRL